MNIFTGTCILCGMSSRRKQDLCKKCEAELPWIEKSCFRCGQPLDNENITECGQCLQKIIPFDRTIALFHYKKPIDILIKGLKFTNKLIYARILGDLLGAKLQQSYKHDKPPDTIIPVPLHKKRLQERGYNQALEIARPIASKFNIPIDYQSCQKVKHTKAQASIPAQERLNNMQKAFVVSKKFCAKHIAIIDDVITTGATIRELSAAFRQHGAQTIDIWCCARTSTAQGKNRRYCNC